ncbi:MAG: hypothetical protein M1812_006261 [Candelaria pacifica]|nr:MAG: hypothetical protein M1812_006261 [Candelaria pacifica]
MAIENISFKKSGINFKLVPRSDTDKSIISAKSTSHEAQAISRGWPIATRTLARGVFNIASRCIWDLFFALLPVPFLVLGIIAAKHDLVPVEHASYGPALLSAAKYGPTVFPIVFAAIIAQFLGRIASLRVEQGERVGVLEQLLGSRTFFNTFVTHFQLRAFNVLGIIIVALWALSPIGGQASLRVVTVGSSVVEHPASFQYLSIDSNWTLIGDAAQESLATNSLFISSLASPLRTASIDIWGNLKIPMLEALNDSQASANDGWLSVPANATYAALIGLPISALASKVNSTFNLETSYWSLDCPTLELHDKAQNFTSTIPEPMNITQPGWHGSKAPGTSPQFELAIDQEPASPTGPRRILFESKGENGISHAECSITTSYVELRAYCEMQSCGVSSIRKSKLSHPEQARTVFDSGPLFLYYTYAFVNSIPAGHSAVSTPLETYFVHPGSVFRSGMDWLDLYTVGSKSFGISLAQLMNTYWLAGIAPFNIPSGLGPESSPDLPVFTKDTVNGTTSESIQILHCHRGWLAVLMLASLLLFFAGLAGLVLGLVCDAPEIFTFASSLTRDNPHISLPPGGSTLDGPDRARLLKDLVIRLGDVRPEEEVGHISIAAVNDMRHVGRLQKRRLYD